MPCEAGRPQGSTNLVRELVPLGHTLIPSAAHPLGPRGPEYRRAGLGQNAQVTWYCYDGLGSVLAEVSSTGYITGARQMDVYGAPRATQGSPTSKHAFVGALGHPTEDDTGLIYMRARWMDPVTGTFVSEDPARQVVTGTHTAAAALQAPATRQVCSLTSWSGCYSAPRTMGRKPLLPRQSRGGALTRSCPPWRS